MNNTDSLKILGSKISLIQTYNECFRLLINLVEINKPCYITVNNVHTVVEAARDYDYREIINSSSLSLPDGKPLSIVAKLKGYKNISRIFGPTLMEYCFKEGQSKNIRHFLFGSSQETIDSIKQIVYDQYPHAQICGHISPPFRSFSADENQRFIDIINESQPDIIWVGLGAPKQERWMFEHYNKLRKGVMIGIGAGFDYTAGNIKHAPEWAKNFALEWLFRLLQEPGRLWKRYLITNTLFIYYNVLEAVQIKKFLRLLKID